MKLTLRLVSTLAALVLLAACQKAKFSAANNAAASSDNKANACTPVAAITRMTKIMFLVDTSGSNAGLWGGCNGPGQPACPTPTDLDKSFRLRAMQTFFNQYQSKTNFSWGFVTFSQLYYDNGTTAGPAARALVNSGGNNQAPVFSSTAAQFQSAINTFASSSDGGDTPYEAAFNMAYNAIRQDPDLNSSANPQYFVVLVTDGMPTDDAYFDADGYFLTAPVLTDVTNLINAAPGRVSLSTMYYGTLDSSNHDLLQLVANVGRGQFADINVNNHLTVNDLIQASSCQ